MRRDARTLPKVDEGGQLVRRDVRAPPKVDEAGSWCAVTRAPYPRWERGEVGAP
ncbi:hypothetical protein MACH21_10230 [Roseicyclus marinus]|uniref:Uncharacterized protein n=1 Tax=Roseicyclus marinus TaxID=2161673 RepID=A0AA48HIJ3_9RHOB|nr:hypothetical protein MACH21_10230 [Roseicyclus marinus]